MINYNLFLIKCFANSQYYILFFIKKKKRLMYLTKKLYIYINCCEIYINNKYITNVVYYYM